MKINPNRAIVFVHKGNQNYFRIVMEQVLHSNPNERIILIGDSSNSGISNIEHFFTDSLILDNYKEFESNYVHLSSNPKWFELVCFERWFLVSKLMDELNLDEVWVNDSDNMVYASYDYARPRGKWNVAFGFPEQTDDLPYIALGSTCFFKRDQLFDFCDFLISLYTNTEKLNSIKSIHSHYQEHKLKGGISDMTAFYLYSKQVLYHNLFSIHDGKTFDYVVNRVHNSPGDFYYLNDKGIKNIQLRDVKCFCRNSVTNNDVEFLTIHFQGKSKFLIHKYYGGNKKLLIRKLVGRFLLHKEKVRQLLRILLGRV